MEKVTPKIPELFIPGVAKAGTTFLYEQLRQHPKIFLPQKETWFFNDPNHLKIVEEDPRTEISSELITDEKDYKTLYASASPSQVAVEVATGVFYDYAFAIPKIEQVLGQPTVVIVLRNPVERAYSAYLHFVKNAWETLSFEEALEVESRRIEKGFHFMWHYRNMGLYAEAAQAFKEQFENVLFFSFDQLTQDSNSVLSAICEAVNIAPIDWDTRSFTNASGVPKNPSLQKLITQENALKRMSKPITQHIPEARRRQWRQWLKGSNLTTAPSMEQVLRKSLQSYYAEDIRVTSEITGLNLNHWLT